MLAARLDIRGFLYVTRDAFEFGFWRGFPSGVRNGCCLVCTDRRNERARLGIEELDTVSGRHLGNSAVTHHVPVDRFNWRACAGGYLGWVGKAACLPEWSITVSRSTRCSPRTLSIGRKLMITPLANQIKSCAPIISASHLWMRLAVRWMRVRVLLRTRSLSRQPN